MLTSGASVVGSPGAAGGSARRGRRGLGTTMGAPRVGRDKTAEGSAKRRGRRSALESYGGTMLDAARGARVESAPVSADGVGGGRGRRLPRAIAPEATGVRGGVRAAFDTAGDRERPACADSEGVPLGLGHSGRVGWGRSAKQRNRRGIARGQAWARRTIDESRVGQGRGGMEGAATRVRGSRGKRKGRAARHRGRTRAATRMVTTA